MRKMVAVLTIASLASACTFSKVAQVQSEPSGARVRLGGQDKGVTPTSMSMGCTGVTSGGKEIELSLTNYRTMKANMEFKTSGRNVIWGLLFFWPSIFIWGKCPDNVYNFRLERGTADLAGKSTMTVASLASRYDVYVDNERVVQGVALVRTPGWYEIKVDKDGRYLSLGDIHFEADVDHVVNVDVKD